MDISENLKPLTVLLGTADGVTETKELADIATVRALPDEIDPSQLSDDLCSKMVALVAAVQCEIDLEFLNRCSKLRIIVRFGMGVDNIDLEYAGRITTYSWQDVRSSWSWKDWLGCSSKG